jgi:hypothetical protein
VTAVLKRYAVAWGYLAAMLIAAAATVAIQLRGGRRTSRRDVTDADADQVGDPGGAGPEYQLP